jgi:PAS domain S-box-containing protein
LFAIFRVNPLYLQPVNKLYNDEFPLDILASAPLIIIVFHGDDFLVKFSHPSYLELLPPEIDRSMGIDSVIREAEPPHFFDTLNEVYSTGVKKNLLTQPYHGVDRTETTTRLFNQFFSPWKNSSGAIVGVICNMVEVTDSQNKLRELHASEHLFRQVAEVMPQLVWIADPDGKVSYYNNRIQEFSGAVQDESGNWQWTGMLHQDDLTPTAEVWSKAVSSGTIYEKAHRVYMNDGVYRWHLSRAYPQLDQLGNVVRWFGTATDIHSQKHYEEKLAESEERLRIAMEVTGMGTWEYNFQTEAIVASQKFMEIFGLTPGTQITLQRLLALVHPDDLHVVARNLEDLRNSPCDDNSEYEIIYRIITENTQEVRWIRSNRRLFFDPETGMRTRFIGSVLDISEPRRIEQDLRRQKELYQNLLEGISDAFISFDHNWNVVYANHRVAQAIGLSIEQVLGKNLWDMFPTLLGTSIEYAYRRVMETRTPEQLEFQSKLSGTWLDVRIYPISDGISVFSTDISLRRAAEEELNYQKQLLQTLTENTSQALFLMDAGQHCIYVNEAGEKMTGFHKEELNGKQLHYHLHPTKPDGSVYPLEACPIDRALPTRKRMHGEEVFIHKDGSFYPVFFTASPIIVNEKPVGTVIEVRDTTEEKKAGRALKESEERFRSAFSSASIGMAITDKDGRFVQVNEAFRKITGYSEQELLQLNYNFITHPEDRSEQVKGILINGLGENSYVKEKRYIRKDGGTVWVRISGSFISDENGEVTNEIALAEDITIRNLAQQKLLESEIQFRQLADLVPQLIWTADHKGNTTYKNKRWDDYARPLTAVTSDWLPMLHPDDLPKANQHWKFSVTTGEHFQTEFRLHETHSGKYRWFLAKAIPVTNKEGDILKWFGTCTDINYQKSMSEQMESLVRQRTMELERSNDDLLQFAHIASHDLKEPLRKIMTFSSRINDELASSLPASAKKYLSKIELAASRMNRMIEGVLEYSVAGSEKLPVDIIDLSKVLHDVLLDLEVTIELKNAKVIFTDLPELRGVSILIHQLFYNLINNSLKFSKPDVTTEILIEHRLVEGAELFQLTGNPPEQRFHMLTISDNGIGFKEEQAARIFHTFTRLHSKDRYEGTGLGLALCRKIINRHQGYIIAEGKEGVGATFKIFLPENQPQILI